MHRSACRRLAVLAVLLLSASIVHAQITAATLAGTVKDDTGGVLPGADIVARNLDTGLSRSAVSSGGGEFTIAGLPPGRYEVRVALAGFNTSVQTVELALAQQAGRTATL